MKKTKQKRRIDREMEGALNRAPKPFRGPSLAFCRCMRRRGAKHPDKAIMASLDRHISRGRVSVTEWRDGIVVEPNL